MDNGPEEMDEGLKQYIVILVSEKFYQDLKDAHAEIRADKQFMQIFDGEGIENKYRDMYINRRDEFSWDISELNTTENSMWTDMYELYVNNSNIDTKYIHMYKDIVDKINEIKPNALYIKIYNNFFRQCINKGQEYIDNMYRRKSSIVRLYELYVQANSFLLQIEKLTQDNFILYFDIQNKQLINDAWLKQIMSLENILLKYRNKYIDERDKFNINFYLEVPKDTLKIYEPRYLQYRAKYMEIYENLSVSIADRYENILEENIFYDQLQNWFYTMSVITDHTFKNNEKKKIDIEYTQLKYLKYSQQEVSVISKDKDDMVTQAKSIYDKKRSSETDCQKQKDSNMILPANEKYRCCAKCGNDQCLRRALPGFYFCEAHKDNLCNLEYWRSVLSLIKNLNHNFEHQFVASNREYPIYARVTKYTLGSFFALVLKTVINVFEKDNIPLAYHTVTSYLLMLYFSYMLLAKYRSIRQEACFGTRACGRTYDRESDRGHIQALIFAENIYKSIELIMGRIINFDKDGDVLTMIYMITDMRLSLQDVSSYYEREFENSTLENIDRYNDMKQSYFMSIKNTLTNS